MTKNKPFIGILPAFDFKENRLYLKDGYFEAVNQVGGLAFVLSITKDDEIIEEYIDACDGFLLTGGPDLDPKHYGELILPYNKEISPIRDHMEIQIAKKAIELKKPLLGICRGIQVMNVALGGSLYQDIFSQIKQKELIQHDQNAPNWYPTHEIIIEKNSWVWKTFSEKEKVSVNSFHHQSVKEVAPGFKITSITSDGIIESIEYCEHPFAVGIQWHPELMWKEDRQYLNIFKELVDIAKK